MIRPNIKVWVTVFSIILIIFLISIFDLIKTFQKELNARTGENVSFFMTAKSVFTFNYDSELEKKLKAESMNHEYKHVSIFYQEENRELIPLTVEMLELAEEISSEILGDYEKTAIDMIFVDRENMDQFSNSEDVAGYYSDFDKVIGVYVHLEDVEGILQELETPLYFFQKKILHEYAHYATFRKTEEAEVSGDGFPEWFIEGIAEYVGNSLREVHYDVNQYNILPLESISAEDDWEKARLIETADPYMQSYFAVNYLIQVYGTNIVVDLIDKTKTEGFYKAFEQITGKTTSEFEEDVLDNYQ